MEQETRGIYQIVNKITGKRYIGSSINAFNRMRGHVCLLKRGRHPIKTFQKDYQKFGDDIFICSIIHSINLPSGKKETYHRRFYKLRDMLLILEREYIKLADISGINLYNKYVNGRHIK